MTKKLLLVAVMICLGGCTMIPKYTRPEAPVPAAWPSGPAYKEPPATKGRQLPPSCNGGNSLPTNGFGRSSRRP